MDTVDVAPRIRPHRGVVRSAEVGDIPFRPGLVRVWAPDGTVAGAGFLVSDRHVLTCAHLLSEGPDPPVAPVSLDFPLIAPGRIATATVSTWWAVRSDGTAATDKPEDIAVLELAGDPPVGAVPATVVAPNVLWEHPFRAFGFPTGHDDGVHAVGIMRERQAAGLVQIEGTDLTGYFVQPGFSGGPVWDEREWGVVGMVVTADSREDRRLAFAIPTQTLMRAWPELEQWTNPVCPYRGLLAFTEDDAPLFFGREEYTARMAKAVVNQPLVAVIGPSGSGKSSVVFAGLVPRLRREGRWQIASFTPGSDPFDRLAAALVPLLSPEGTELDRLRQVNSLASALKDGSIQLRTVLDSIAQMGAVAASTLLIVDQFEELYAPGRAQDEITRFLDVLLSAFPNAETDRPTAVAVLTLRADFLGRVLSYRPMADALRRPDIKLGPMSRGDLEQVITGPLAAEVGEPPRRSGVQLQSGLLERILDDVRDEPGNLPLLEFGLSTLWGHQSNRLLTHEAYTAIDGVRGALIQHAESVLASMAESERHQTRSLLVQLVNPGSLEEGTADTRRRATRAQLGDARWALAAHLAARRLVVIGTAKTTDEETVEVVHEALVREWPTLKEWMSQARTFRLWQERLRIDLNSWEASVRDEGVLLRGARLAEAEQHLAERGDEVEPREREFIELSRALRQREEAERARQREDTLALRTQLSTAAGSIGSGLGYAAAFGFAYWWEVGSSARVAQLYAAAWFPLGVLFGIVVGIALRRFRDQPARRMIAAVAGGSIAAGVVYLLARRWTTPGDPTFEPAQLVAGAVTGAALALGVAAPIARWQRLVAAIVLGLIGLSAAVTIDDWRWELESILISGVLLGGLTGAGFFLVDVDAERPPPGQPPIQRWPARWRRKQRSAPDRGAPHAVVRATTLARLVVLIGVLLLVGCLDRPASSASADLSALRDEVYHQAADSARERLPRDEKRELELGDTIDVTSQGEGRLDFSDGFRVRLFRDSALRIEGFSEGVSDLDEVSAEGAALFAESSGEDDVAGLRVDLSTSGAVVTALGTRFLVYDDPQRALTWVIVSEGEVTVALGNVVRTVPAGWQVWVQRGPAISEVFPATRPIADWAYPGLPLLEQLTGSALDDGDMLNASLCTDRASVTRFDAVYRSSDSAWVMDTRGQWVPATQLTCTHPISQLPIWGVVTPTPTPPAPNPPTPTTPPVTGGDTPTPPPPTVTPVSPTDTPPTDTPMPDTTSPPQPVAVAPSGGVELTCAETVILQWSTVQDASGIAYYSWTLQAFSGDGTVISGSTTATQAAVTLPESPCGRSYAWQVAATDGAGNVGSASTPAQFSLAKDMVVE